MKKLFSNPTGKVLEVANQFVYSLKVLMIGLFIPFTFIFGISYKMANVAEKNGNTIKSENVLTENQNTVNLVNFLPDQNA
jgi:hypothetical protein